MQTASETTLGNYEHLMLQRAPVGLALVEAQTLRLLSANPSYQVLFEPLWQPDQVLGRSLAELLPEGVQAQIVALFDHVIQTGLASQAHAYQTISPTGGVRYWDWTLSPILEEGQVRFVHVTITEVTTTILAQQEVKRMQDTLRQGHRAVERERQRLSDLETILLSVKHVTEPKELAHAVLAAVETCFAPEQVALYGKTAEPETFLLLAAHPHVSASASASPFPTTLSSRQHVELFQAMTQHMPIIKRKSEHDDARQAQEWCFLPETCCLLALPLWETHCEGVLLLTLRAEAEPEALRDTLLVCAPRLAEALASSHMHAALADEKRRLHTILDQLPEGVLLVEARTSQISYANPVAANLLGLGLPTLMGTPLNQSAVLSPYGHTHQVQQSIFRWNFALIDALWGKTSIGQELVISRADGSEVVVLSSVAPICHSQGFISEAVIVFQDITAIKQLEQHKEIFFAVANHELRTPLTIISGFVELLQMQNRQQATAMSTYALASMQEECDHLLQMIQDVLDVSRPDQTSLEVHKTLQDLLVPLKASITKQIQTTTTHQLHFLLEDLSPTDQLLAEVDLPRIEQVVRNLITNAVKYSPAGSTIEVGMRPRRNQEGMAQEVILWVKDQGIGISAFELPHIFERFYRAGNIDRSTSGFGIGLYLTRHLVQAHGGRIWAESTLGKGSTFFAALPLGEHWHAAS